MNNIYVDELPKSCSECSYYYGNSVGCLCYLSKTMASKDEDLKDDCPLKLFSDRLKEERKKVVQEIKKLIVESTCYDTEEEVRNHLYDMSASEVLEILDQIENGDNL